MQTHRFFFSIFLALAGAAPAICATYDALEIVPFNVPAEVNLPDDFKEALQHGLVEQLQKTQLFSHVFLHGQKPDGAPDASLRLTGSITTFNKGNRAERYVVGFGAGKTSLRAHIQFVDTASGMVKFESDVEGKVTGYFKAFGGESKDAADGLAKEVAKDARKKFPIPVE